MRAKSATKTENPPEIMTESYSERLASLENAQPPADFTLQHPRCVINILRRHYARYTPEMVASVCGCTVEEFLRVAETICANSGREKTTAIVYAVGWTQHSTGVQIIRAAGIIQLLLGNIGRPGGGIMAMRGHASIQGSTDIPTLYNLLPGYIPQPAAMRNHGKLRDYLEHEHVKHGYWSNLPKFIVSLLKAWYGEAATKENDWGYDWLPRLDDNYSQLPTFVKMAEGKVKGLFLFGQNPAAGSPNAKLHRYAMRQLDWLVVRDWFEIESACYWYKGPDGPDPKTNATEIFFMPAASSPEKEGTLTNTQRLLQWHDKAVDPPGDCRSDLWFLFDLGKRLKRLYAGSTKPRDQGLLNLTWDYDYDAPPKLPDGATSRIAGEPDAQKVLKEINGYTVADRKPVSGFSALKDDGSTACGCWIYSGVYPKEGYNRARERKRTPGVYTSPNWGFAWPHNRRMMYNRASADPEGRPWSDRKKYIWWDAAQGRWTGVDEPDFEPEKAPCYRPPPGAEGMDSIAGDSPFIMKPDGKGWLFAPSGAKDGPLPAHYEPVESPVPNELYAQQENPAVKLHDLPLNLKSAPLDADFPVVATTFRLTEHYLSGPMSRFNSWLNELQPEMFIELSPELAAERGIQHGGWMVAWNRRAAIEARAMVTRRVRPLLVNGRTAHQIAIPFHWGFAGETVGSVANDLTSMIADPNVSMHEAKAFVCNVRPGRIERASRRAHGSRALARVPRRAGRTRGGAARGAGEMSALERIAEVWERPAPPPLREETGFFTDTSLCIGCKACEVACKQWNQLPGDGFHWTGNSYDNTVALSATTWRHVAFIEQMDGDGHRPRWLMMSDVCKHCVEAPCVEACPTGSLIYNEFGAVYVQQDICNGCAYCVVACPFGVIDRNREDGGAYKCTLCYDRQKDGMTPACAKSCPTESIQFGPVSWLREKARRACARIACARRDGCLSLRRRIQWRIQCAERLLSAERQAGCIQSPGGAAAPRDQHEAELSGELCGRRRFSGNLRDLLPQRGQVMAPAVTIEGYYGLPMLKRPLWKWEIALYFFAEGISSGSYILGSMADLAECRRYANFVRNARYLSLAALLPCPALLVADLGRPARFHHMLRVFKPRSPMNMGAWALTAFAGPVTLLALAEATRLRRSPARAVTLAGLPFALFMLGYPGVLLSTTSIPVWSQTRWLGAVLGSSSLASAAGALSVCGDKASRPALHSIAAAAHAGEALAFAAYIAESGPALDPLTQGRYSRLFRAGAIAAGIALPPVVSMLARRRSRPWAIAAGALSMAGALALKWAIVYAGHDSAADPAAARRAMRA